MHTAARTRPWPACGGIDGGRLTRCAAREGESGVLRATTATRGGSIAWRAGGAAGVTRPWRRDGYDGPQATMQPAARLRRQRLRAGERVCLHVTGEGRRRARDRGSPGATACELGAAGGGGRTATSWIPAVLREAERLLVDLFLDLPPRRRMIVLDASTPPTITLHGRQGPVLPRLTGTTASPAS